MPLKNRNLAILIGCLALFIGIFGAYYKFMYDPLRASISQDKKTVDDLNTKLSAARARAGQLNKIQTEMASLQVDVAQLEKQLPKNRELPSLLRVVTHRAESYGIFMSNLAPGKPISKGLYDEIPFKVTMTSSFHSLGHFLTAMGKGDRLFAARNLAMQSGGGGGKADPTKTVNSTFELVAFKYHE